MKIVIAPDSFKESMTSLEAATAIEKGFKKVLPNEEYLKVPMADGGEGTVQSIIDATGGSFKTETVKGPLGESLKAQYGLTGDKKVAVIEMAASSGLDKVEPSDRNPLKTSTYGFGELIHSALDEGVEEIILGIGGSATNDGGAGMIMSLGGKLLDKNEKNIFPTGEGLKELQFIDVSNIHSRIKDVTFRVACDVDNPLTGPNGASYIYGPQKGGDSKMLEQLDKNLVHYAEIVKKQMGKDIDSPAGAGAAGGLGAGLLGFLDAKLQRGGDLLVEMLSLEDALKDAALLITGEGSINHQTRFGKTPVAVSHIGKKLGIPTIALAGSLNEGYESIYKEGIDAAFSIIPQLSSLETVLANGKENVETLATNIATIIKLSRSL
ncbi:MAG: glycerate kinase [Tetragenococcus halophilus]|uniref:Glycerate kinase n=1 Tax=Tetragenococcus halophilus TaxID=51669 RepID=A0AB35HQP4_TETHA|nr:glycerate kinase [Tetragenococcus halophilus]AOF48613.1 glycerate kinase [Tetragenococcus halophilus]MCO8284197.1 glycerate kinase [Tetragenococcus halophilus]MCO8287566.1 glycerate kinase [Tetragenococcus halophilus]MCO8289454.1 glycerate kinase [Tetragenococcus halophilus]MCO8291879.1 glycerate kinase [Tetragenococcus halophilus]